MRCIFIRNLTCLLFVLFFERLFASGESENDYSKGCAYLRCETGSRCVKRRFWCKDPPCPGMLYCSKSRKESLTGPPTCDTVHCSKGHICIIKVRGCHWDGKCKQQFARCVSEKEYEGAASCAGFECPSGERCILQETNCINPPCKLIRSCKSAEDVQTWFDKCRSLNCTSEYECFLRRPKNNCLDSCTHMPDCMFTIEDELISKYCYGWICPPAQKCMVRIVDSCKGFNCNIERSCRASSVPSAKRNTNNEIAEQPSAKRNLVPKIEMELIRQELEKKANTQTNYPITEKEPILPVTSMPRENIRRTTPIKHGTEILLTRQQIATTKSNLITESLESSTNEPHLTLSYPRLNYNKSSTIDEGKVFQNSISPTTLPTDGKTEPTMLSRDMKILETPRIYIAADNALPLPMTLKDINFLGQGYPIWTKNDRSLEAKDENGWRYQKPYKILLPPYEPAILVESTRRLEQLPLPFFIDVFDHLFNEAFNEAALITLSEITPTGVKDSKTDSTTIADDKIANYTNGSMIEIENIKTNHSNDSFDDHVNFPPTEKTNTAPPSDKELDDYYDNYEWRWYMIHESLERNEPQLSHEQGSKSSIVDLATDDFYRNDTLADAETTHETTRSQITSEKRSQVSEMRYIDGRNKNLATFSPSASTRQSDYSTRNEKLHGLVNYDTISVHHVGKSSREYGGSSRRQIFDVSSTGDGN